MHPAGSAPLAPVTLTGIPVKEEAGVSPGQPRWIFQKGELKTGLWRMSQQEKENL